MSQMILKVIFVQRKCNWPGEYAPEAMECMTEYDYEQNPEWLDSKLREYKTDENNEFTAAKIVNIKVNQDQISAILNPVNKPIEGTII